MSPPTQPVASQAMLERVERATDAYFGQFDPQNPQRWVLYNQALVAVFLGAMRDAFMQVLQLCQQFMPEDMLARVTGGGGVPLARTVAEIQGKFDLDLTYDVRELNFEYIESLAKVVGTLVLPMDTQGTVMRDQLVARVFGAIDPNMAETVLQPASAAGQKETEDEELAFTKIAAGIEPPLAEQGVNFPLRLQVLMGIAQKNPEAVQQLAPKSQEILKTRLKNLQFGAQQMQNAMIGRTGTAPALG